MARRSSPARLLAPIALVSAAVAVVVVVQSSRSSSDRSSSSAPSIVQTQTGDAAATTPTTTATTPRKRESKVYVVKAGDILSTVSETTGVSVERIMELNPTLDPQALQVGQRIKLSGRGGTDTPSTTTTTQTP